MEFLSAVTMFNSAFLGLTASLTGFLLLSLWGGMLVWGIKVERPLYKMLGIMFASMGISMLFGLYENGAQAQPFPGGVLGHWVGERCAASGMAGFSCFLLWLAVPAGLLLATDWFFVGFFFGGRGPVPVTGGLGAAFSKSIRIFSSSEGKVGRQRGSEKRDPRRGATRSFPGRSFLGSFGRYRRRDRGPEVAPPRARRASDRRGVGHAGPKAESAPGVVPAGVEEETIERLDSGSSVALAETGDGNAADITADIAVDSAVGEAVDSAVGEAEGDREYDSAAWWKSETPDEAGIENAGIENAGIENESARLEEGGDPVESPSLSDGEIPGEEVVVLEKSWWTAPSERQSEEADLSESETAGIEPEIASIEPEVGSIEPEAESIEPEIANIEPEVESITADVEESRLESAPTVPDSFDERDDERDLEEDKFEEGAKEEMETPVEEEPRAKDDPEPHPQTVFSFSGEEPAEPVAISDEDVDLFRRAVTLVVEQQKGSISLLQKDLGLGYFKAAKLLTTLEAKGVVAPYAGSIARKVTISEEQAARIIDGLDPH